MMTFPFNNAAKVQLPEAITWHDWRTQILTVRPLTPTLHYKKKKIEIFFFFISANKLKPCLEIDFQNRCWLSWLVVETHWQSETGRGRRMLESDVSELLVQGKQIWRTLFL